MLFLLIVKLSVSLLLVLSTGPGLGVSSFSLTWIVLSVIDLAWKIFHWLLYTAERLSPFDCDLSTTCFCANQRKSLQYLFFYCPLEVSILSWLQSLMFLAAPLCPTILLRRVLFGFSSNEVSLVPQVFICLTSVNFWVYRNDFRFRGKRPSAVDVMERVKSRVRFHLPWFFPRRFFVRQWCGGFLL